MNAVLCLQKRWQQAKQASHQTRLSVLAAHKRLKHHLSQGPPAAPSKPTFRVGKKGKKAVVALQVSCTTSPTSLPVAFDT